MCGAFSYNLNQWIPEITAPSSFLREWRGWRGRADNIGRNCSMTSCSGLLTSRPWPACMFRSRSRTHCRCTLGTYLSYMDSHTVPSPESWRRWKGKTHSSSARILQERHMGSTGTAWRQKGPASTASESPADDANRDSGRQMSWLHRKSAGWFAQRAVPLSRKTASEASGGAASKENEGKRATARPQASRIDPPTRNPHSGPARQGLRQDNPVPAVRWRPSTAESEISVLSLARR